MTTNYGGKGSKARPYSNYAEFLDNFDEIPNMGKNTLAAKLKERVQQEQAAQQSEEKTDNP